MQLLTSCKTTPIVIRDYKKYDFQDLIDKKLTEELQNLDQNEIDALMEILRMYANQIREIKYVHDDLIIQIKSADGDIITVISTKDPPSK